MNNDGIFEEGGGGGVPDDIDIISVCAVTGNFQNLGVGPCGNVNYKFPPNKAENEFTRGIIVSEGATVSLAGPTAVFLTTYSIIGPFVRNLVIPDGNYTIQDLLETLKTTIEAQFAIDGATNTVTLTLDLTGRINFTLNAGNIISILLSNVGGWLEIGNTINTSFAPGVLKVFTNLPVYNEPSHQTEWQQYLFNKNGDVFNGNMTVTGSLTTSQLITDLDVEDPIITLNKNAPNNDNVSGLVLNSNANLNFSGLLKQSNTNDFYLFAGSSTLPTTTGWVPEKSGNLLLESVDSTIAYTKNLAFREVGTEIVQADMSYDRGAFSMNFQTNTFLQATSGGVNIASPTVSGNSLQLATSNVDLRFAGNDGISLDATQTRVRGPAGVAEVRVDASDVKILNNTTSYTQTQNDINLLSQANFINLSPTSITLRDTTVDVLKSDSGNLTLQNFANPVTPTDKVHKVLIDRLYFKVQRDSNDRFLIDGTETKLWSPDLSFNQSISNSIYLVKKGLVNRLYIDDNFVDLESGNSDYVVSVGNDRIRLSDIGGARMDITGLQSIIKSPNKTNFVNVDDDGIALRYGAVNRFLADVAGTTALSEGGLSSLILKDLEFDCFLNGVQIIDAQPPVSRFYGGPTQNTNMFCGGNIFGCGFQVEGTVRILAKTTITTISSPDTNTRIDLIDLSTTLRVAGGVKMLIEADATTISNFVDCQDDLTCQNTFKIGVGLNQYSFPSLVGGTGQVLAVTAPNTLSFVGSVLYKADLTTEIDNTTPILLVGAPVILQGASSTSLTGFTVTPGQCQLTYTGLENISISAYIGLSGRAGDVPGSDNALFEMSFYKNSVKQAGKTSSQLDTTNTNPKEMSLMRNLTLVTGDVLDVRVINQTLTNSLITNSWTLSLHKIGY
jgi:hypothetical protein